MTSNRYCVGVWGHYYGANLGDDLVAAVVMDAVRARRPNAEVRGFSMDPADTERRHAIRAWPIMARRSRRDGAVASRWRRVARGLMRRAAALALEVPHLWRSYRALRDVHLLVVAGSGPLLDSWGTWAHPYTLFKWAMLARLARTDLAMLSVGAGPVDTRLGRAFLRRAAESARYVSVRDEHSAEVLRAIGVRRALPVYPDMAFGLELPDAEKRARVSEGLTVGLNPMPHASSRYRPVGDEAQYEDYLGRLAAVANGALAQGATLLAFSSQAVSDPPTVRDVLARVQAERGRVVRPRVEDIPGLVEVVGACDYVVATRFHCVVLPLLMGIPTVGIAYDPKTRQVMEVLGVGAYCHDIESFDADVVLQQLGELQHRNREIRDALAARAPQLRAAVAEQFDLVFGGVEQPREVLAGSAMRE